jgi:hypothetical protein
VRLRQRYPYPADSIVTGAPFIDRAIDAASARLTGNGSRLDAHALPTLVVCGYPRSGNTFVAEYLRTALPEHAEVLSNRHSPIKVQMAADLGVPVVVPVREPLAAVASWMLYLGESLELARAKRHLLGYRAWHGFVMKVRSPELSLVVPFDEAVATPDSLLGWAPIHRLNPVRAMIIDVDGVVARIAHDARDGAVRDPATQQSVPHPERAARAAAYAALLAVPELAKYRRMATEVHAEVMEVAGLDRVAAPSER